jgi:hypothetical protein
MERSRLPNGLWLELWDESRKVAGDRWYVAFRAVLPVPLPEALEGIRLEVIQMLRRNVGDHIYYQFLEARNFIAEKDVPALRDGLKGAFLATALTYLSHPDFSGKFLIRKAREIGEKMICGEEYVHKLLNELRFSAGTSEEKAEDE